MVSQTNYSEPSYDNAVSSIKVRDGCTLKAYKQKNKEELLDIQTSDVSHVKDNDAISSYSCSCEGKFDYTN